MDERYYGHECRPVPPPPDDECCHHHIPVIVERVMKPYHNPDGSFANRKYYQYPVTKFSAIYASDSMHSPTLEDVLRKYDEKLLGKQSKLAGGDKNTILTRGKDDGLVGELTKSDYMDNTRRSKTHVPSEYALYKVVDSIHDDINVDVDKETARAIAAENNLMDVIRSETGRAKDAEEGLSVAIQEVSDSKVSADVVGTDGKVLKSIDVNFEDLDAIQIRKESVSLSTGNTEVSTTCFDLITPIKDIVDEKLGSIEGLDEKVDKSVFNNVGGRVVVNSEFTTGSGSTIGRFKSTTKDINGENPDVSKTVAFKSDDVSCKVDDVSETETEIVMTLKFVSDEDVREAIERIYG